MDDIRAQLDALMGQDRNVPLGERDKRRSERKFSDENICKYYICGFCPHEEFRRTKNDCGDCPLVHDEGCRKQWEELDDRSKERYGYEAQLLQWFDRLLGDLRKRIDANTERLAGLEAPLVMAEDQQRLDNLTTQINELLAQAASLGEQGEVDASQAATSEAERLKVQRGMLEQGAHARANAKAGRNLHQKVCQVSGLIINDEESRLTDHYSGRNYNSWKKMHEVHAQLLEAARKRRAGGGAPPGPPGREGPPVGPPAAGRDYRSSSHHREERDREGRRERDDRDGRRRRSRSRSRERRRSEGRDGRRYDDRERRRYDDRDRDGRRRYDERERERDRDYRRRSRSRDRARSAPRPEGLAPEAAAPPAPQT